MYVRIPGNCFLVVLQVLEDKNRPDKGNMEAEDAVRLRYHLPLSVFVLCGAIVR